MTLAYDCENRLTTAGSVSYTYDWLGRRVSRTVSGGTTTCVYDGGQIIAEYNGGTLLRKYIYGPGIDEPVCMVASGGTYYYHFDGLGSVAALTDSGGTLVEKYRYDAFGGTMILAPNNQTRTTSLYGNRFMFTGREFDTETGLYYYRARMYSPALGRFLQTDPIGYYDSMNLYAYCLNNPINWIDPWGEARRQERPLDIGGLRHTTIGPLHHDRFLYNNGTDSGYYDDSTVREDRANQTLQGRYNNLGGELDDRILRQAEENVRSNWDIGTNSEATPYKLRGKGHKNCQDYCDAVEQEYDRLKKLEENSRKNTKNGV